MKTRNKLLIGLIIIYLLGLVFFSIFTYPSTYLNGKRVGMTVKDKAFESYESNPVIEIKGRKDKSETLTGSQISYSKFLIPGQEIDQNPILWPIGLFTKHEYNPEYEVSYDKNAIDNFLINSSFMTDMTHPKDAHLVMEDGTYKVIEEEMGDTLDKEAASTRLLEALKNGEEEVVFEDEYIKPGITKDSPELAVKLENARKLAGVSITFDMGDGQVIISGEELLDFYVADGQTYSPLREEAYNYVVDLAVEYDTFSESQERPFTTSSGNEITVVGGIYGWLIDVEATTDLLVEALQKQETTSLEPIYIMEGLTRGKDDIGQTYIEISLTNQKLWFYKDGSLITQTDIVSGDPTRGVATHTGVGKVWSREKDRDLVGIVPEGTADYSSFVDFWMPINWDNEGIHNSKWRDSFGGDIYLGNGSYGCINLPYEPTEIIFNNVEINTPVVVY